MFYKLLPIFPIFRFWKFLSLSLYIFLIPIILGGVNRKIGGEPPPIDETLQIHSDPPRGFGCLHLFRLFWPLTRAFRRKAVGSEIPSLRHLIPPPDSGVFGLYFAPPALQFLVMFVQFLPAKTYSISPGLQF